MGTVYRPCKTFIKDGKRRKVHTGIWWIRYRGVDGRLYAESTGKDLKEDAKKVLVRKEGKVADGIPITPDTGRLTFDDAVADVVTDYRINGKKTLGAVERRIKLHLVPFFGGSRMASITTTHLRRFIEQRQAAGASNAEINRELAIIKRAYRLAIKADRLHHRPDIPMLQEQNARSGFFEAGQFESVRRHLPSALRPVVTFAYLTGWRVPSEVLPLTWAQVDRQDQTLRLEPGTTKNREGRTFPYGEHPDLKTLIEKQWTEHERLKKAGRIVPYVFHRGGVPIRTFYGAWRSACKDAGCPGRLLHDLRRTAVRNLVRAGVPEKSAMLLTGHKTRSVFERYNIVRKDDLRDAVAKLAGVPMPARHTGGKRA